jgi:hypothetical protein
LEPNIIVGRGETTHKVDELTAGDAKACEHFNDVCGKGEVLGSQLMVVKVDYHDDVHHEEDR